MSHNSAVHGRTGSSGELIGSSISTNSSGLDERQWNALIGIITAIIGNVLISFALNLQRYAHIRINREKAAWELRGKNGNYLEEGTQAGVAKWRLKVNLKTSAARVEGTRLNGHHDENTPLRDGTRSTYVSDPDVEFEGVEEDEEKQAQNKNYLKSPWWWAGIILMTIGEAGNFLAYGFAPASIVSPLGVVALISNCIVAPCLLKERFRQRDFWGVLTAIAGVVTLVLSAKNSEDRMGPDDIWSSITRWEFELYLGLTAAAVLSLVWASSKYGKRTILIDVGLVALFGGYTVLSTKGIASLLSGTLWRTLTFPITYLLVFILVSTAVLQIRYLNKALSRFDSTVVIPTQFVMFTISVIVGSAILYRDFESADAERVSKFIGGCALTFLGVFFITSGRSSNKGVEEGEPGQNSEEGINLLDEADEDAEPREGHVSPTPFAEERGQPPYRAESRRGSRQAAIRPVGAGRFHSNMSHIPRPLTPPSPGLDSPLMDNPWVDTYSSLPVRKSQSQDTTTSSIPADSSEPTTPRIERRLKLSTAERPSARHRRSIADIFPGPISSPLSSSFSGVAADARRKELDATPSKSKQSRLALVKSQSSNTHTLQSQEPLERHHSPTAAPTTITEDILAKTRPKRARSQSLGESLGYFFRRYSKRARDEEQGQGQGSGRDDGEEGTFGPGRQS